MAVCSSTGCCTTTRLFSPKHLARPSGRGTTSRLSWRTSACNRAACLWPYCFLSGPQTCRNVRHFALCLAFSRFGLCRGRERVCARSVWVLRFRSWDLCRPARYGGIGTHASGEGLARLPAAEEKGKRHARGGVFYTFKHHGNLAAAWFLWRDILDVAHDWSEERKCGRIHGIQ